MIVGMIGMVEFNERVYSLCKLIPKGKVSTYGEISRVLGSSPRAVGQALRCNPFAPIVPCHRVVKSNGALGGFMGETVGREVEKKLSLLASEGVLIENGFVKEFKKKKHTFYVFS